VALLLAISLSTRLWPNIVFEVAARPLADDVLSGYNATILAYGQTSSGKACLTAITSSLFLLLCLLLLCLFPSTLLLSAGRIASSPRTSESICRVSEHSHYAAEA